MNYVIKVIELNHLNSNISTHQCLHPFIRSMFFFPRVAEIDRCRWATFFFFFSFFLRFSSDDMLSLSTLCGLSLKLFTWLLNYFVAKWIYISNWFEFDVYDQLGMGQVRITTWQYELWTFWYFKVKICPNWNFCFFTSKFSSC